MGVVRRKVSFYYVSQEQKGDDKKKHALDNAAVERNFRRIYEEMSVLKNKHHVLKINVNNLEFVIEVIQYDPDMQTAFIRIGNQNFASSTALRDQATLEASDVPMSSTQRLEVFTYCFIDFSTCIASYISINNAPQISVLKAMFDSQLFWEAGISTSLDAIMSRSIIDSIKGKRISKISVSVAVPGDKILSERIGVGRRIFNDLYNIKRFNYSYSISANRLKSMFNSPDAIDGLFADIQREHGENLVSLKVNAGDFGEETQIYDLLQQKITKQVSFDVENISELNEDDFLRKISECYRNNKADLIAYIPGVNNSRCG